MNKPVLIALLGSVVLAPRAADASPADAGIVDGRHAIGMYVAFSPVFLKQPDDSSEHGAYAAASFEYRYRWRFLALGLTAAFQTGSFAAYPVVSLTLPVGKTELGSSIGYGLARLWSGQKADGLGSHTEASLRLMYNLDATFDFGVELALSVEAHRRVDMGEVHFFAIPLRFVGRYRF